MSGSWGWSNELHNFRPEQPYHHGLLSVETILALVQQRRLLPIDDVVGYFFAAMSGQTMHHDGITRGALEHRFVELEFLEIAAPLGGFLLLAHRGPGIGINHVGILDRRGRVVSHHAQFFAPHPLEEAFLRLVARGTSDAQLETAEGGRLNPALRHVEAIADERDAQLAHVAAVAFLHRHEIGKQLAWMQKIAQPVDYRHRGFTRELDCGLMGEGANHNNVDGARNIARHILNRFTLTDSDVTGGEINRMAAELRHPGFEGDTGAQRRLLKNHRESFPAQMRMLEADFQLSLQARSECEQSVKLVGGE